MTTTASRPATATTAPKGARTGLYLRISSDPSGRETGVTRQRTECLALAERLGLDVVETYTDNDTSAYSRKPREHFERLMTDVRAGHVDVILVWAADRLYRRLADLVRMAEALGIRPSAS